MHSDLALARAILDGDRAAFGQLVERLHGRLSRLARTLVSSAAIADEVVQETWLAVLDNLGQYEGRASLKTWVFHILVNKARTRAKRESRSLPFSALGEEGGDEELLQGRFGARGFWSAPPTAWPHGAQDQRLIDRESVAALHEELGRLPEAQRAVVIMRDVEELSAEEVCNVLEISESNQRVLLHRGRARLRAALERHFAAA